MPGTARSGPVRHSVFGRTTWFVWTNVEQSRRSTSPAVAALTRGMRLPIGPESVHRQGLTEVVGAELQDRLSARVGPKLLARLDPLIDLFDRRLHRTCGNGQAQPTVLIILHPLGIVRQISHRVGHNSPGIRLEGVARWWAQLDAAPFE